MKNKKTKDMQEYTAIDAEIKKLLKRKQELRESVIKDLLRDPEGFEGLNISKKQIVSWLDDEFYNWVREEFPEYVENVTKKTIDYEKFEDLVKQGKIVYNGIPAHVYKSRTDYVINISKNRNT